MTRTTTPDAYTEVIHWLREMRREGRISLFVMDVILGHIWEMRHARP